MADTATTPDQQMSPTQFAQAIKQKFPQYKDVDDALLTHRILAKYPQYKTRVKFAEVPRANPLDAGADLVKRGQKALAQNVELMENVASEQAGKGADLYNWQGGKVTGERPVLLSAGNLLASLGAESAKIVNKAASGLLDWKTASAMLLAKLSPTASAMYFLRTGAGSAKESYDKIQKEGATPDNVQNFILALAQIAGSAAAVGKAAPIEGENLGKTFVKSSETVRKGAQILAGVGAERTTRPLVEEYKTAKTEAEKAQAAENAKTEEANRGKVEKHATAKREAFRAEEEAKAEHASETEQVKARNEAQEDIQSRRGVVARAINQGSEQLGNSIKQLEQKVRQEGNQKYDAVKAKVVNDPGVPTEVVADAVRHAKTNILKGSPESIREFSAIESRDIMGSEMGTARGEDAGALADWDNLEEQVSRGDKLKFDQLQGFSSEIGTKLAKGNLPGDVYQALKYVKEAIDKQKAVVADRNGAGAELKQADSFWRGYLETFYDKQSAVAATLARVGKLDPQYYAEPFLKGKSAGIGIKNLEKYDPDLATKVQELRDQNEEFQKLPKKAKTEALPEPPKPGEPPARPELKAPKKIEQPKPPTEEDVVARKKKVLTQSARRLGELNRFDVGLLSGVGAAAIGELFRGNPAGAAETAGGGMAVVAGRKAFGEFIQRPKVQEWLSKPTAEDLRILKEANPEAQTQIKDKISEFLKTEAAHGNKPVVAPELKKWLGEKAKGLVERGKAILKDDEGSATVPGTGAFDWSKTSSVGANESGAFDAAKEELYPGKKDLSAKEASAVSRRATEITQERKAAAGSRQGTGETHPGKPVIDMRNYRVSDPALNDEAIRGRAREMENKYPAKPATVPAMRRQLAKLNKLREEQAAAGDSKVEETDAQIEKLEDDLADIE